MIKGSISKAHAKRSKMLVYILIWNLALSRLGELNMLLIELTSAI